MREQWTSLNGEWDFAIDFDGDCGEPSQIVWNQTIRVPFSPETSLSGVGNTSLFRACWYRRMLELAEPADNVVLLHFGAVDFRATVWVNGSLVGFHEGGYTPFTLDITAAVRGSRQSELIVRVQDDPSDLEKPRGKQDWSPQPHSIWYPRTTGIWQSAWLEQVPATRIDRLRWTPNLERWEIGCAAWCVGPRDERLRLRVRLSVEGVATRRRRLLRDRRGSPSPHRTVGPGHR